MENIERELKRLDATIKETKASVEKAKGSKEALLEMLQERFGVKTIKEAEKLLAKKTKEHSKIESDIQTRFENLQAEYDW